MKFFITFLLFLLTFLGLDAQDARLAREYYSSGEYEKAAVVYKKLYEKQPHQYSYFNYYVQSLLAVEEYETAENEIKATIKKKPNDMHLYVTYGNFLERQNKLEESEIQFRKAIDNMPANITQINNLGNSFTSLAKYDLAIETFLKSDEILDRKDVFVNNLAEVYRRKNDVPKMIEYYIKSASGKPTQVEVYKTKFQRYLKTDEQLDEMKAQLYDKIQAEPENSVYPELLAWVFIEREDYKNALRQSRALDRKYDEDGTRVMKLAKIAANSGDYETALKAYNYIFDTKGKTSKYYIESKAEVLNTERKIITRNFDFEISEMDSIENEYESFIEVMGINANTASMVKEFGDFLAVYKNDLPKAIKTLEDLVHIGSIDKHVRANSKIALADYYLMQGEIWESTLLYSQVEKDFTEEYLGEVSRFRNAKLAYYAGEFAWAQEQFSILKTATSKLISNDAIDMSVFIMDNMGLDTTDVPLKMFAKAELLTVQNRFDAAIQKLDSIVIVFPEHSLEDDILYQKAELHSKQKNYDLAVDLYTKVFTDFAEEIRADNALFKLADLYENQLNDPDKAKEFYEKLFIDFSNSTYAIEARKRYRLLRGDDI